MADKPIDTLKIQINSDAKNASDGIERLASSLLGLGKATDRGQVALKSLASGIRNLNTQLSGVKMPDMPILKDIDKLSSINIDKSVSRTISSLGKLSQVGEQTKSSADALPEIGDSVYNAVEKIGQIGEVDTGVNRFVASMARLASAGDKAKTVSKELPTLGKELRNVVKKMSSIGDVTTSVNTFVQSLSRLANAGSKTNQTATGLQSLTDETLKFFQTMSGAPQVSENTLRMTEALSRLASAGGKVGASTKSTVSAFENLSKAGRSVSNVLKKTLGNVANIVSNSFSKIGQLALKSASAVKKAASTIASAFSKITSSSKGLKTASFNLGNLLKTAIGFKAIKGLVDFGKNALEVGSDITEVENVVDVAFGSMAQHAYDFASTATEQFGLSELAAKQYSGTMMAMLKSSGVAQSAAAKMSTTMAGLAGDIASFYNIDTDEAFYKLRSAISGETEPMKQLGVNMNVVNLEAFAMSRGITKAYKDMTLAEQATLRYNYILDKTGDAQGDFARTAGTWANQVRLLKLNFQSLAGVIGQGLIAGILPAIKALNALMSKLMGAATAFRNFMYTLMGKKIESSTKGIVNDLAGIGDASTGLEDLGDSAEEAGKKLKKNLFTLPFDELNILSEDASSLGDNLSDIGGDFDSGAFDDLLDKDMETPINKWAQKIRDAFLAEDWEGLGKTIAEMMNAGLQKVYDAITNITPKIEQALKNFARVFNSWEEYFDWDLLGRTIGAGVNLITKAFNALTGDDGINFELLGNKLSVGFRGLVDEIDWRELGNALGNGFMVAWRIFQGFVDDMWRVGEETFLTGWAELGNALAEGVHGIFERVNFGNIGKTLADAFNGIFEILNNFNKRMSDNGTWQEIANNISNGLNNAIKGIRPIEAAQALGKFVTDLLGTMLEIAENTPWHELGTKIGQFLTNIPWLTIFKQVTSIITTVVGGLFSGLAEEILNNAEKIGAGIADAVNFIFEKLDRITEWIKSSELGKKIADGLNAMISDIKWKENGEKLNNLITAFLDEILTAAKDVEWDDFGRGIGDFLSKIEWGKHLKTVAKIIMDVFGGLLEGFASTPAGKFVIAFGLALKGIQLTAHLMPFVNNIVKFFTGENVGQLIVGAFKKMLGKGVAEGAAGATTASGGSGILATLGSIATKIGGFTALIGGAWTAITNFFDMLKNGFSWLKEILMVVGVAVAAVGAVILGAPALVAGVVAAIVAAVGTAVVLIKEHWEEIKEFFANLWTGIKETAVNAWNAIGDFLGNAWQGIQNMASSIWGGIKTFFSGLWEGIRSTAENVWNGISGFLNSIWQGISSTASSIWGGIKNFFGSIWDGISSTAQSVWNGITGFLSGVWQGIQNTASSVWGAIKNVIGNAFEGVSTAFSTVWSSIKTFLSTTWEGIKTTASNIWSSIKTTIGNAWNGLKENAETIWGNIKTTIGGTWDTLKEWSLSKFEAIKTSISNVWEKVATSTKNTWNDIETFVGEKIPEIVGNIVDWFSELPGKMFEIGKNIIGGLIKGITDFVGGLKDKVVEVAGNVSGWFKEKLGIHSPSTVFSDIANNVFQGFINGSDEKKNAVIKTMGGIADGAVGAFGNVGNVFGTIGSGMVTSLYQGVDSQTNIIIKQMYSLIGAMQNSFSNMPNIFNQIGANMMDSLSSRLMSGINNIKSMLGNFASSIRSMFSNVFSGLSFNMPNFSGYSIPAFATGGFPENGLFFANSTELVGKFSNGKTAVANNEQITAGIEEAAYRGFLRAQAETPYLQEIADNTRRSAEKDLSVNIGDRDIVNSYRRGSARMGHDFTA